MAAAGGSGRVQTGMGEGIGDLAVQFLSVCDDDHTGVAGCQLHQNVFCQHDHGQALAAALSVPHDTTLAVALAVGLPDGFDDLLDGKILLIAADLLHIGIEQNEIANQFLDPFPAEEGDDIPVLLSGNPIRHQTGQCRIQESVILLFPDIPELLGRAGGGVFYRIFVGGHDDLGILV